VRQIGTLGAGRVTAAGLSAAWLAMAARILSPHGFGDLTLLLAIGSVAGVAGDMGLQMALARYVAETQRLDAGVLRHTIHRRLLLGATVGIPVSFFYLAAASDRTVVVPLIFIGSLLGTAVYSSDTIALNVLGQTHIDAGNEVTSRLFILVVGVLWLEHGGGLLAAVTIYATADICSALIVTLLTRRHLHRDSVPFDSRYTTSPSARAATPRMHLRQTAPLALALLSATLYAHVDVWILALLRGTTISGRYAAADRILDGILLLPSAVASVSIGKVGPRSGRDRRKVALGYAGVAIVVAAIPGLVVAAIAHPLLSNLFGPRFGQVAPTLVLLLASSVPGAAICVLSPLTAITASGRYLWCVALGLAVNITMNLLLIPSDATNGAAIANLVSESILCLSLFMVLQTTTGGKLLTRHQLETPMPVPGSAL